MRVEEACRLLDQYGYEGRIMAGGTDIIAAAKLRNIQPTYIISLKGIDGLKGITYQEEEGLKIGAMTPLYHVRQDPLIREHYQALAQAAAGVGSPQIQRMGTLGGNLCLNTRCYFYNQSSNWRKHRPVCLKMGGDVCHVVSQGKKCYAAFSADTPPALIAFNAKVKLVSSKGIRLMSVRDLYTGDGKDPAALNPGEILTEIQLPPVTQQVSIYLKYRIRKSIDFPLIGVAAKIGLSGRGGTCNQAKIILNAVGPAPIEVFEAETFLKNSLLSPEVIEKAAEMAVHVAHPVANIGSTPAYRRKMVGRLTQKALGELAKGMIS
jgi:4-hydroxybenzoyl-CoA reductase subunit beta